MFIENKGQFDSRNSLSEEPLFGAEFHDHSVYFSKTKISYRYDYFMSGTEELDPGEKAKNRVRHTEFVQLEWINGNANTEIIAENFASCYFKYPNIVDQIRGSEKITYKNIYPNIDIEYIYHHKAGLKYNIILHPGANPDQIELRYEGLNDMVITAEGNLLSNSNHLSITDHKPETFYEGTGVEIQSNYTLIGNSIKFNLSNYDVNQTVIIDPWTTAVTTLSTNNRAFDISSDAAGNIYIAGGTGSFPDGYKIAKFSSAGALIWTSNTGYDGYYGDMVTDAAGNCYFSEGAFTGRVIRVNTDGSLGWSNTVHSGAGGYETWSMAMNDAGTTAAISWLDNNYDFGVGYLNLSNGNTSSDTDMGLDTEMRSMCFDPSGNLYALTCTVSFGPSGNRVIKATSALANTFFVNSSFGFEEWSMTYSSSNNFTGSGFNGVAADNSFLYTMDGATLQQRNILTGAVLNTIAIPGGGFEENGGIDVDECGDVYVGSKTGVHQFDNTLSSVAFVATPNSVYDVRVGNTPGEILACGRDFVANLAFTPCLVPLDASSIEINSTCNLSDLEINWTSQSENNIDYFEIEKCLDGENFESIQKIIPQDVMHATNDYRIKVNGNGKAYYRLKTVSKNGVSIYSNIIFNSCGNDVIDVYPTLVKSFFNLKLPENTQFPVHVEIIDFSGRVVLKKLVDNNNYTPVFNLNNELKSGMFNVHVLDRTGKKLGSNKIIVIAE